MTHPLPPGLADLPPLWATEGRETAEIILPLRFTCRWHALVWYPVEREGDALFGLTVRAVPEWRHFHISELTSRHHGEAVLRDPAHRPAPVPEVPAVGHHHLDDIRPFIPTIIAVT